MSIPKAFISYSHDSQEHKKWVLDFAVRLRNSGVDAILDQWELRAGDDIPCFMEKNLSVADRVLMICTERYVEKANSGSGGVGYEKMIVTADLMRSIDSNKVVPIIRQVGACALPNFLKTKLYIDFSSADQLEFAFDELIRTLHGKPLFVKPPVGSSPFVPVTRTPAERNGDPLLELMRLVVADFERHSFDHINYDRLRKVSSVSRLMLDMMIEEAKNQGLITQDRDKDVRLTLKGKQYALHHKIHK